MSLQIFKKLQLEEMNVNVDFKNKGSTSASINLENNLGKRVRWRS